VTEHDRLAAAEQPAHLTVDARLFEDVILSAAFDCRRVLRRITSYSQSPDHPVLPSIPETEYLKGYAYEIVS
jgi:23S rRNA (cytosine1962-C5)-methyltransferase